MKCHDCGFDNPEDNRSCANCGTPLSYPEKSGTRGEEENVRREATKPGEAPGSPVDPTVGLPRDTDAEIGKLIANKYEVLQEIGRGGMGLVYRARDTELDRDVAIKRLNSEDEDGVFGIDRFRQEAKAIAALNHHNIVVIHELGGDSNGPFIVMELVDGSDLGTKVAEEGPMQLADALGLMKSVCGAVSYAHKRGVVHRDIKPSNVLLTSEKVPKLVDFGLARIGTKSDISQTGLGMGTLSYVAPEQMTDATSADHRSDIYSLGKTFYEVLTGETPDTVDYDMVPKQIRDVLRKCLRTKPEERYPSVDEMIGDLQTVAKQVSRASAYFDELGPGVCAACGGTNDLDARFCTSCGSGLFSVCPSCKQEVRTGLRFCKHCRTNIPVFIEVEGHLATASRYMKERKYHNVVRSCRAVLELDENHEGAKQLLAVAGEALERLEELKREMESAIDASDVERAQELLEEAETLTDSTTWLEEQDEALADAMISMNLEDALSKVEEGFYSDARWSARQALRLGSEDAQMLLLTIQVKKRQYTAKLREASEAIASGRYGEVERILEEYKDKAGFEAARDLIERANDTAGTVDRVLETARRCLKAGAVSEGLEACRRLMESDAHSGEADKIREYLEHLRDDIEKLLERGEGKLAAQEYEKAIDTFREVTDRVSREGAPERERAEDGIRTAEDALDELQKALAEARARRDSGDFDAGLQACEKILALQKNYEEAKAIKAELERHKLHQAAETYARGAFRSGDYPRAIQLWEAMLNVNPDDKDAARNLEEAKLALRRQGVRRIASFSVVIMVLALAFIGFVLIRTSDPLAEARSLAEAGEYVQALEFIKSLREAKGDVPGAALLERACRFEIALKGLRKVIANERWTDIMALLKDLRRGILGGNRREKLAALAVEGGLLETVGRLPTEGKMLEAACVYSVLHLADPSHGYQDEVRRELEWLGSDLLNKKRYDEALVVVEQAKVLLDGQELEDIEKRALEGKAGTTP